MDQQVGVVQLQGHSQSLAPDGLQQRAADVQVQGVSEFIVPGGSAGFDSRGHFPGVVPSELASAQGAQQVLQGPVPQEVEALVGELEANLAGLAALVARPRAWTATLGPTVLGIGEVSLFREAFDQLVNQLGQPGFQVLAGTLHQLFQHFLGQHVLVEQGLQDGVVEVLQIVVLVKGLPAVGVLKETTPQQEVGEVVEQVLQAQGVPIHPRVLGILDALHG